MFNPSPSILVNGKLLIVYNSKSFGSSIFCYQVPCLELNLELTIEPIEGDIFRSRKKIFLFLDVFLAHTKFISNRVEQDLIKFLNIYIICASVQIVFFVSFLIYMSSNLCNSEFMNIVISGASFGNTYLFTNFCQ